jgi:hypothetical protein
LKRQLLWVVRPAGYDLTLVRAMWYDVSHNGESAHIRILEARTIHELKAQLTDAMVVVSVMEG